MPVSYTHLLGGFYLDILKDRLYTAAADSAARRSAQSALWHITQAFVKLLAPILSFTAEEVWKTLTRKTESVMLQTWQELPAPADEALLLDKWGKIRLYRAEVTRALEELRVAGLIGSSLQAEVRIHTDGEKYDILASLGDDLRFVLILSLIHIWSPAHCWKFICSISQPTSTVATSMSASCTN